MHQHALSTSRLDRLAMSLSGLCVVHCVATAVLLGLVASAGGLLGKPIVHEVGLSLAMIIGAFALGRGYVEHGFMLPAAVGAMSDAKYQTFVDEAYAAVATRKLMVGGVYYEESWTVMSMLMLTGNFVNYVGVTP